MTHDHSDATCEGCPIGRRTFVSQATLAAAAALLAEACGTGVWEPLAPSGTTVAIPSSGLSFKLADYPALAAVGGVATVSAACQLRRKTSRMTTTRQAPIARFSVTV